ncbi:MAG: AAA family ATPase [Clostridium sp.]
MYIERHVYKDFLDWKDNSDLVLLVEGARQVGKTYLATKFANENFKNVIYINIADDTGKVFIDILNKYISIGDEKKLLLNTLIEYSKTFTNTKDTVVIIDEIQESSLVYNKIRSFNRLMYCRFIVTGSYLGRTSLSNDFWESAGDFKTITIYPLSFREFLGAVGNDVVNLFDTIDLYGNSSKESYDLLKEYYNAYISIGGYPAVVNTFLKELDMRTVYDLYDKLLLIFAKESARYLQSEEYIILIKTAFNYFARLLIREKKGMQNNNAGEELIKLSKKLNYREGSLNFNKKQYTAVLSWLLANHALYGCDKAIDCDLMNIEYNQRFYFNDLGILNYLLINMEIDKDISMGIRNENYVCIVLKNKKLMTNFATFANYELDFLLKDSEHIYGIEVKTGKDSGKSVMKAYEKGKIDKILYLKGDTYGGVDGNKITIPIYLFERFNFKPTRYNNLDNIDIFRK